MQRDDVKGKKRAVASRPGGQGWGESRPCPRDHLIFLPAMVVASLPALELAVASTFGASFLGFLASLLPRFLSLDMGVAFEPEDRRADAGADRRSEGSDPVGSRGLTLCDRRLGLFGGKGKGCEPL